MMASEYLLQVVERVFDLQGQIDTFNAAEVIDPEASWENTEAYVKESFEDLKTFQRTP